VFGQINLCPSALSGYYTSGDAETAINLVMHEMTHTMVMDASLFPLFRYKDVARSPRTPRDPLYPSLPAPEYNMMYGCKGSNTLFYVPANATLAWFSERGMFCSRANASSTGGCVTRLVTPAVREAARTFFGCADLAGAEVENYDTSDCAFVGSHWCVARCPRRSRPGDGLCRLCVALSGCLRGLWFVRSGAATLRFM